jgi:hypothetical protein
MDLARITPRLEVVKTSLDGFVQQVNQAILRLGERLAALEARAVETERKAEAVLAGERHWQIACVTRDKLVLRSGTGEVETIPLALARMLNEKKRLTVEVRSKGGRVTFESETDEVVAEIPTSLFVVLDRALAGFETTWDRQNLASQSRPSRASHRQTEARGAGSESREGSRALSASEGETRATT